MRARSSAFCCSCTISLSGGCQYQYRNQNIVGRTRFFDLRAKGLNRLVQTFFLLIGCGELVTEALHGFLEARYLFF